MEPGVRVLSLADPFSPWSPGLLGLLVYFGVVVAAMAGVLLLTAWIGVKKPNPAKEIPYESGVVPTGSARLKYPVPFYLVAVFFLVFDVEAVFIYSWASAFGSLGWFGWLQMTFFIVVLFISLVYVWKKGGLDWGTSAGRNR